TNSIANGVTMSVVNVLQHPEFDTLSLHDALPISPRLCSMIPGNGLWTSDIADQHVCGSRMTIVPLRFDERVIYQKSRALQILSLAGIAGERPSIHSSEQVTRLRIAHGGFRYDKGDRAVSVKAASRQGPDLRFRRDANNQT